MHFSFFTKSRPWSWYLKELEQFWLEKWTKFPMEERYHRWPAAEATVGQLYKVLTLGGEELGMLKVFIYRSIFYLFIHCTKPNFNTMGVNTWREVLHFVSSTETRHLVPWSPYSQVSVQLVASCTCMFHSLVKRPFRENYPNNQPECCT